MSFLLDTNVIFETIKRQPNGNVIAWLDRMPQASFFVSVLTLGELRKGVEKLDHGVYKSKMAHWFEYEVTQWLHKNILIVDQNIAENWGRIAAQSKRTVPVIDSLLAATAIAHRLTLVTRNEADFDYPGLRVFNPWESRAGD